MDGCYKLFHTCWDIESEKENLRLAFEINSSEDTAVDKCVTFTLLVRINSWKLHINILNTSSIYLSHKKK